MTEKIKIAVIGAGHLGRFHARLLAKHPAYELSAIVDPSASARESVAQEVGVRSYDSHESLLSQEHIESAVVASPTKYHYQIGVALLRKGKHLLVEKPLASNLLQAESLVATATANQCVLQVGHIERFNPALAKVYQHVERPHYIEAKRVGGYSFRSTDIGVVFDLMIHDVDVVLSLLKSKPIEVNAVGVRVVGPQEDLATARLVFEEGCVVNLTASRVSEETERRMHIWAPQCFVDVDYAAGFTRLTQPTDAFKSRHNDPERLSWEQKREAQSRFFSEWLQTEQFEVESRNALDDELTDFATAINTGSSVRVDGVAGQDAVAVCEQILENMVQMNWEEAAENHSLPSSVTSTIIPVPSLHKAQHRRAG